MTKLADEDDQSHYFSKVQELQEKLTRIGTVCSDQMMAYPINRDKEFVAKAVLDIINEEKA
jgi:hypothetical protein